MSNTCSVASRNRVTMTTVSIMLSSSSCPAPAPSCRRTGYLWLQSRSCSHRPHVQHLLCRVAEQGNYDYSLDHALIVLMSNTCSVASQNRVTMTTVSIMLSSSSCPTPALSRRRTGYLTTGRSWNDQCCIWWKGWRSFVGIELAAPMTSWIGMFAFTRSWIVYPSCWPDLCFKLTSVVQAGQKGCHLFAGIELAELLNIHLRDVELLNWYVDLHVRIVH